MIRREHSLVINRTFVDREFFSYTPAFDTAVNYREQQGGANAPAYWAPASLIRPTPKKTPVA